MRDLIGTAGTGRRAGVVLAGVGIASCAAAAGLAPGHARSAAAQTWPAFVLVAGLLLVGLVADEDGVFAAAGHALARVARGGIALYAGTALLVVSVTTVLNLDTSVTFLTPVVVYAARSRREGEAPLLYSCLLLSNAGSLILPGSNLTNLIVLGHLHLSGGAYAAHMALPGLAAAAVTAVIVGALHPKALRAGAGPSGAPERPVLGAGLAGTLAVTVLVLVLRQPAVPVLVVGLAVVVTRARHPVRTTALTAGRVLGLLGIPVLAGLFGAAVALGALGRSWAGPATLLAHLDAWGTAAVAAGSSVLVNNLPAASLLAARTPPHPYPLLVGLNIGPNLAVTGSLAWFLWLRSARAAGSTPSVRRASLLGFATVPLATAVAVALLVLEHAG